MLFKRSNINVFDRTKKKDFFLLGLRPLCLCVLSLFSSGKYSCKITRAVGLTQGQKQYTTTPVEVTNQSRAAFFCFLLSLLGQRVKDEALQLSPDKS